MNLKVIEIYELTKGIEVLTNFDLPFETAFKLHRIEKKLKDEHESLEKMRIKIVNKHKESEDKETGTITLKKDSIEQYQKEIDKFSEQKIDIDIPKIHTSELTDVTISAKVLGSISSILEIEEA